MKKKCSAVKKLFGVDDELLLDVEAQMGTACATNITIPGRLFIMRHHVLFFTEVFGTIQKITIPKTNILELKRRNESLVVETKDHITHVFLPLGKNRELLFERLQAIEDCNLWAESQNTSTDNDESEDRNSAEEDDDDGGFEWISRAAREDGFLDTNTDLQEVVNTELSISIKKFFLYFLQDEKFFKTFHERRGDTEFVGAPWKEDPELGNVRQLQYRSKVNAPFGPPTTIVNEVQRYYSNDPNHLVIETMSSALDVQYGDSFRVEAYWNVSALSGDRVKLTISAGVAFLKKIHMPGVTGMIRSRSIDETTNSFTLWVSLATEEIERKEKEQTEQEKEKPEKLERAESQPAVVVSTSSTATTPQASPVSSISSPVQLITPKSTPSSSPIHALPIRSPSFNASSDSSFWTSPLVILVFLASVLILCLAILWRLSSISAQLEKIEALVLMSAQNVAAVAGAGASLGMHRPL